MLLEFLVGIVDRQLLKTVFLEGLEAEDIENAETVDTVLAHSIVLSARYFGLNRVVDLLDDPIEQLAVDGFGARVSGGDCFIKSEIRCDYLARVLHYLLFQNADHSLYILETQKFSCFESISLTAWLNLRIIVSILRVVDVTQVQDGCKDLPNLVDLVI